MGRFKTTAAYISGGICGTMWMPEAKAGFPYRQDLRGPWGCYQKGDSFEDIARSVILNKGGDFRDARFTADTVIRIERTRIDAPGRYDTHVVEIPMPSSWTDADCYTSDICGEE